MHLKAVSTDPARIPGPRIANKAEVAEWFDVSLTTIHSWVRRGCPVLQTGGRGISWQFDLLAVALWYHAPETTARVFDPEDLPPKERRDWWSGEEVRLRTEETRGRLVGFDVVALIIGAQLAEVRAKLLSHHNTIAAENPELSPDVIRTIQQLNKAALKELSTREIPKTVQDALDGLYGDHGAPGESDG